MSHDQPHAPTSEGQAVHQFLENEAQQNSKEAEVNYVPIIETGTANNGVLQITISNIEELWALEFFENPYQPCFKIHCKWVTSQQRESDIAWHDKVIMVGAVSDSGHFWLSLDPQLDAYHFIFSVEANNMSKNQWMDCSKQHTVKVPSFSLDTNFSKNEYVEFRKYNDYQPIPAQIVEVLDNDMFKLQYEEYDSSKADYVEKTITLDLSRLYKEEIDHQYLTRIHSTEQMEKDVFLQRNDRESYAVWHVVQKCLSTLCVEICYEVYSAEVLVHYTPMSMLLSRSICQYLFEPQFEHKVNCFINDNHGSLQLINVRRNYLELHKKEMQDKRCCGESNTESVEQEENEVDIIEIHDIVDGFDDARVVCDWCWVTLGEYELYYHDADVCMSDGHDVCVSCVASVIRINAELKRILQSILQQQLIIDCIDVIADYVIGSVKTMELVKNTNASNKTIKGVKRRLNETGIGRVCCKKRKYNTLLV